MSNIYKKRISRIIWIMIPIYFDTIIPSSFVFIGTCNLFIHVSETKKNYFNANIIVTKKFIKSINFENECRQRFKLYLPGCENIVKPINDYMMSARRSSPRNECL